MRLRCPVCHADAALEAWAEDDAARELMALLSTLDATLGRPLVAYLGLWRSASRALAWDRALRIAREVLALDADAQRLAAALTQTVEQLRAKRDAGDVRPLASHGYLSRVLKGTQAAIPAAADGLDTSAARRLPARSPSATVDGVMRLEALKRRARGDVQ
ncbi:hypothetical protein [Azohydromonas sediminis]|uniref:hypothetical protein n=1 Tax=Azohydromonas sediminis TaxID=2259674 RepID=UPI000E64C598|nr:hypothetical protein [Azohydromonas sediminis]